MANDFERWLRDEYRPEGASWLYEEYVGMKIKDVHRIFVEEGWIEEDEYEVNNYEEASWDRILVDYGKIQEEEECWQIDII